jgi:NADH-quinone oxidoreductase subunit C
MSDQKNEPAEPTKDDAVVAQEAAPTTGEVARAQAEAEVIEVRKGMFGAPDAGDTSGYGGLVRPVAFAAPADRPLSGWHEDAMTELAAVLDDGSYGSQGFDEAIEKVVVEHGELTLFVRRDALAPVAQALRDEPALRFEICSGVSGVHYPDQAGRELHAIYPLLSITHNTRIRLEVTCPDDDRRIPSVVTVWPGNDWHERETWDMFGIEFVGHPALTRILMPDDWPGHPQRKDYPLGGIPVEYKGAQIPPPDERRSYS